MQNGAQHESGAATAWARPGHDQARLVTSGAESPDAMVMPVREVHGMCVQECT